MTPKAMMMLALGAAALAIPAAASAQPYYGQPYSQYDRGYGQPYGRGDFYQQRRGDSGVYPEFRGIETHIRQEIVEGVREDLIERDDARDLMGQLRDIQSREMREFRVHGWNLPDDDRYSIRSALDRLDRLVDQIRDEE